MKQQLYEVWGDTVDSRHLGYSILIGAVVSLGAFFIAQHFLLSWVASAQMARAYAMLVGILGCLGAGMISASLFKPKRIVVEHQADPAQRAQLLQTEVAENQQPVHDDVVQQAAQRDDHDRLGLVDAG
uniref:hypothetical protein n=1 Tax=Aquabacterium sp. TaxID=1872578 RepID=UPI0025B98222